jgi:hypothetical protein
VKALKSSLAAKALASPDGKKALRNFLADRRNAGAVITIELPAGEVVTVKPVIVPKAGC